MDWHRIRLVALLLLSPFALIYDVGARWIGQRWMCSNGGRWEGLCGIRGSYCGGALACELVIAFTRVEEGRDYNEYIQDHAQSQANTGTS